MTGGGEGPLEEDEDGGGFGVSHFDEVLLQFNTKVRNAIYPFEFQPKKKRYRMHKTYIGVNGSVIKARYRH